MEVVKEKKLVLDDFELNDSIPQFGSSSFVKKATFKNDQKSCVLKFISKQSIIINRGSMKKIVNEKSALLKFHKDPHPFIIHLFGTINAQDHLVFVLEEATNGDLFEFMKKRGKLGIELTRYYVACIVVAISEMRKRKILHLDLKPENILLDENYGMKIADFGSCMILEEEEKKEEEGGSLFRGTPQFMAPELIKKIGVHSEITFSADLWSLGVILYKMLTARYPFIGGSDYLVMKEVLTGKYKICEELLNERDALDLIQKLLVVDYSKRIGFEKFVDLMSHKFFEGIDFEKIIETKPPI